MPDNRDELVYEGLGGPELDEDFWSTPHLPLPTGEHIPRDPNAEQSVGDGEVRVTIPRFSLADDQFQAADSVKFLTVSTHEFELPPDGPATFAVELAAENIGGNPTDYRQGIAAFQVADLATSKRVFSVCGTSTRVLALHEHLPLAGGGPGEPFVHMAESPYEDFDNDFTRFREGEITLDRSESTATWRVDGHTIYEAGGAVIPEAARIAFGIYTQLPIKDGRSQSNNGQGMEGRWRRFRVSGIATRVTGSEPN